MKNLFAINMNDDTGRGASEQFILRRVDEELSKRQDESTKSLKEHEEKATLPKWLTIIRSICLTFFFIVLAACIKASNGNIVKVFTSAPWLIISGAVCGFIALVLWIVQKNKERNVLESRDLEHDIENAGRIRKESLACLQIPENAGATDVFSRTYKIKNGKEKRITDLFEYINFEFLAFREGDMLCLADIESVIGIPTAGITGIYKINKRVSFSGWNKEEHFHTGSYKPYKITENKYGTLYIKPHYSLRFTGFGEEYEILFPAYELDTFVRLTGASVKEEI